MDRAIGTVLARPGEFFEEEAPSARGAAVPVVIGLVALGTVPVLIELLRRFADLGTLDVLPSVSYATGGTEVAVEGVFVLPAVVVLVGPLLLWSLYGLAFHAATIPFAGRGSLRRTLSFVAWGFLPQLLASVVALAVLAVTFPSNADALWGVGITLPARITADCTEQLLLVDAAHAVGVLCTLWSAYVWVPALATARGTTRRQALAVVALVVAVSLALSPPLAGVLFS